MSGRAWRGVRDGETGTREMATSSQSGATVKVVRAGTASGGAAAAAAMVTGGMEGCGGDGERRKRRIATEELG